MAALGVAIAVVPPGRIQEMRLRYAKLGGAMVNLRPAMEIIGVELTDIAKETFLSQGRRGGGSWKQLSYKRQHEKAREGIDPRILFGETHRLYTSATEPGSPENIIQVKGNGNDWQVILATKVPYAKAHWAGVPKRNLPQRKFFKRIASDQERFDRILRQYFWDAWASMDGETTKAPRGHFNG